MSPEENPKRDEAVPPGAAGDAPSGVPGVASADALGADQDDSYVARVARGAGISTVGQGIGRVAGYLVYAALGGFFGKEGVGLYALGVAAVNGAQILARFGMDNGVVRWIAHYQAQEDAPRVRGTIVQALGVTFAISVVLSVLMFFGSPIAAGIYNEPRLETIFRVFALALPPFTLMSMLVWATQGFQTVTYATYTQQIIRPLLNLAFIVAFYVLVDNIIGAVLAYTFSMIFGAAVALYYLRKLFPPLFDGASVPARYETRALFDVSVPMSVTTLAQYANNWAAIQILGLVGAGTGAVGVFTLAARTATFLTIVRFAFGGIFSPIISSFNARGALDDMGRLYKDVSRWIFTGGFGIFLLIVVLGRDALAAIRPAFAEGWVALIIVAAAQLYSSSVGPTPRMLAMTGNQRVVMVATAAAALVGIAVAFVLSPGLGILGAALGMAAGIVTENTATLIAVRRRLGFWPYDPTWLKPLIAGLAAAALAYLVNLVAPFGALLSIAVVGAVFGIAYLALLFVLGLSETDKEFLGAFWNVARRHLRRLGGRRKSAKGTAP